MTTPDTGRPPDFAIDPDGMRRKITFLLAPVVQKLDGLNGKYTAAHDEIQAAHASQSAGWFGGVGNGDVRSASSSFLNTVEWQLRQLASDQAELASSLLGYQTALLQIIDHAVETDRVIANRFRSIENQIDGMGTER
ncbi:hypothetical protein ALI144C_23605 [Actinosynnema sp. ALI-1.44]|uniref:hypothetical protein n=1 Tax=Actinosynnema sp. ALI-1.44 TaxID=1933779 RepID=UPI00097C13FA|nr:hypothetical protein [Actinosynnema sp. ALI-1.44]ONI79742.1 hypothetical protein ALI144C_23605 [Actinosynnema sp. ALI-1.44]